MYFCNQLKKYAKPSTMLEKNPIKVVTEANFLSVVFDWTLLYMKIMLTVKKQIASKLWISEK